MLQGVPEVSVAKLRHYLQSKPAAAEAARARLLLAEALLSMRDAPEALEALADPGLTQAEAEILRGRAYLRLRSWTAAIQTFGHLLKNPSASPDTRMLARLGLAAAEYGDRDLTAAAETLGPELDAPTSDNVRAKLLAAQICLEQDRLDDASDWLNRLGPVQPHEALLRQCLQGEIALRHGDPKKARSVFNSVAVAGTGRTGRSLAIAQIGLSRLDLASQDYEDAEQRIVQLINDQPRAFLLPELFRVLFQVYSAQSNASDADLTAWAREDPEHAGAERPAYALFYLAKLRQHQGIADQAPELFRQVMQRFPQLRPARLATLELARDSLEANRPQEAIHLLQAPVPGEAGLEAKWDRQSLLAEAYARAGRFAEARGAYAECLDQKDAEARGRVCFNMALCSLRLHPPDLFEADYDALTRTRPDPRVIGELLFQKGRFEASQALPSSSKTLQGFITEFPQNPRVAEARLILAERTLLTGEAGYNRVAQDLEQAPPDPNLAEQKDQLAFFAAADDPNQPLADTAKLAQQFLERYPSSTARADIHLKLGEVYFRASDYASARTQFELVHEEQPESPLAENALFLAGEAARRSLNPASVDQAIALFEEVYKLGGNLRFQARLEQALTKRQVQQEGEAITLLNDLLASNPPADVRIQALEAKGQAEFALGQGNPDYYVQAKQTLAALTTTENPAEWRQRGFYGIGKCFEKLGQPDEALAAYDDALNVTGSPGDQVWFFRAGFDAAQILEQRKAWSSAGAVYEKLANTRSARAAEAKERLTKLRLQHFLWPD